MKTKAFPTRNETASTRARHVIIYTYIIHRARGLNRLRRVSGRRRSDSAKAFYGVCLIVRALLRILHAAYTGRLVPQIAINSTARDFISRFRDRPVRGRDKAITPRPLPVASSPRGLPARASCVFGDPKTKNLPPPRGRPSRAETVRTTPSSVPAPLFRLVRLVLSRQFPGPSISLAAGSRAHVRVSDQTLFSRQ